MEFLDYLRGEVRFEGADALIAQKMHRDAAEARRIIAGNAAPSMLDA